MKDPFWPSGHVGKLTNYKNENMNMKMNMENWRNGKNEDNIESSISLKNQESY